MLAVVVVYGINSDCSHGSTIGVCTGYYIGSIGIIIVVSFIVLVLVVIVAIVAVVIIMVVVVYDSISDCSKGSISSNIICNYIGGRHVWLFPFTSTEVPSTVLYI